MAWQDRFSDRGAFLVEVKRLVMVEGNSYSKAAAAIGFGCSKNQIVRAMQTIMGKTRSTVTFPDSVWPSTAKGPGEKAVDVPEVPVHILRVRESQCRAPLWPDFIRSTQKAPTSEHMMCGHKCREGSTYCDEHHERFYPPELQKRKAPPKREEVKDNSRHFK